MPETTRRNGEQWPSNPSSTGSSMADMANTAASQALDVGEKALDAASEAGRMARVTMREYPVATAALIAGLAFAMGALWKSGSFQRRSGMQGYIDRLQETVGDLPRRYWRS